MKIIVCIKQIPDTNDVRWTKENNLAREGLISVINPNDLLAIQTALSLKKENSDTEIILISMGPKDVVKSLRYGLSMGADCAILLSDKAFGGADTNATSKTLACAIKNYIKDYDLILTGQFAKDGDTAQTPYSLSVNLGIPVIGYVEKINRTEESKFEIISKKDEGKYTLEAKTPFLCAITHYEGEIYKPLVKDYILGQQKELFILNKDDIGANCSKTGIKGSPTYVVKAFRPESKRECIFLKDDYIEVLKSEFGNCL